ncbi:MAG TPA: LysR family transcriptional regulator [Burkholderiales bacterium]|jgi:LysR family nitrogen assimilation transcriptional regulator
MDLKLLRNFLQIAEVESFTKAAAVLHIAQPALSRQIGQLERELGVKLFTRTERGVHLTEAGVMFRQRARGLVDDFQRLRHEVSLLAEEPSGELTLGVPPSMHDTITLPLVRAYRKRFPRVLLRLVEGLSVTLNEGVHTGKLDLAIVSASEPRAALTHTPLVREGMFLVGARAKRVRSSSMPIEALAGLPLIVTLNPNALRSIVEEGFKRARLDFRPALETNSIPLMLDLVEEGAGYTVLSYCAVQAQLQKRKLAVTPVAGLSVTWALAASPRRTLSRPAQALMQMLFDTTKSMVAAGKWKSAEYLG